MRVEWLVRRQVHLGRGGRYEWNGDDAEATPRGHRRRRVPVAVGPSGGASGGRTTVSTSRTYFIAFHPFHGSWPYGLS